MSQRATSPLSLAVLAALGALALPACTERLGGAKVNVTLVGDAKTKCLIGWAKSATGSASYSDPVPRTASDLVFGIQETPELVGEITVGISLFSTENCAGNHYFSTTQLATLTRGELTTLNFVIDFSPRDGGTDAGVDDGGVDAGCDLSQCTAPPECRGTPATCGATGCDYPLLAGGSPCDGGVCNGAGECGPNLCAFAAVNDPCVDGLDCTTNDVCLNATTCRGTCQPPASSECTTRANPIACGGDGGCVYTPNPPNSFCSSPPNGRCSTAGECTPWFPLPPSNLPDDVRAIAQPTAAWTAAPGADGGACIIHTSGPSPGPRDPTARCGFVGAGQVFVPTDGGAELAVFAATSLTVPGNVEVRFVGARPAVLAIFGDATISGRLSAAGRRTAEAPAGAGATVCPSRDGAASQQGGGGGSFRTKGGNGGNGGAAGTPNGTSDGEPLRGGCPGGRGNGTAGGAGGVGGGALQVTAAGTLTVDGGVITASGSGGHGGAGTDNGGGGGGSGGTILLEAPQVRLLNCAITANGGGGGQGGRNTVTGGAGADGSDTTATAALGGDVGNTAGGKGGNGAVNGNDGLNGANGSAGEGGGGGGGGVGLLRVNATNCQTSGGSTYVMSGERTGTTCN